MNYSIIKDPASLQHFIDWLPDLKEHESFYVVLLARNKYVKDLGIGTFNSDKHQCKRFISKKERLFEKIQQLECPLGSYVIKDIPVPQESLALYISPNPRDLLKATRMSLIKFAELIANGSAGHAPHQEVISQIHKSCGTKHFVDFDFDGKIYIELKNQIDKMINPEATSVLDTRGGFHLLVHLDRIHESFSKSWYRNISAIEGCDIKGDNLIPVPGCTQGGFVPIIHSNSNSYSA